MISPCSSCDGQETANAYRIRAPVVMRPLSALCLRIHKAINTSAVIHGDMFSAELNAQSCIAEYLVVLSEMDDIDVAAHHILISYV